MKEFYDILKLFCLSFLGIFLFFEKFFLPLTDDSLLFEPVFSIIFFLTIFILLFIFLWSTKNNLTLKIKVRGFLFACLAYCLISYDQFSNLEIKNLSISWVWLYSIFTIIGIIITFHKNRSNDNFTAHLNKENDRFQRYGFSQEIVKILIPHNDDENHALNDNNIIGLVSPWGSGKTCVLEWIREMLTEDEQVVIWFNPLGCRDEKQIIAEFLSTLKIGLQNQNKEYFPLDFHNFLNDYSKLLTADYSSFLGSMFTPNESRMKEFDQINDVLNKSSFQVFIIVDDLDRLDNEEVLVTLRLIRKIAKFDKLTFIAAYDKQHISQALKDQNIDIKFLDKIFPNEVSLPKVYGDQIIDWFLKEHIFPIVSDEHKEVLNHLAYEAYNSKVFLSALKDNIKNLRDVKRVSSSFSSVYQLIKDEILVSDLLMLTIIKDVYPLIYKNLCFEPDLLLTKFDKGENVKETNVMFLKKDIDGVLKELELNDSSIKNLKAILSFLFSSLRNSEQAPWSNSSMLHPALTYYEEDHGKLRYEVDTRLLRNRFSYDKYFSYGFSSKQLSVTEFKNFLLKEHEEVELKKCIEKYIDDCLTDFIHLLQDDSLIDITEYCDTYFKVILQMSYFYPTINEQKFWAKVLWKRLPDPNKHKEAYDKVSQHFVDKFEDTFSKKRPVLYLELIFKFLDCYPQKSVYNFSKAGVMAIQTFKNALKQGNFKNGLDFMVIFNLTLDILSKRCDYNKVKEILLKHVKKHLESNEDSFKSFLEKTINSNNNKLYLWLLFTHPVKSGMHNETPIFDSIEEFQNYIQSIDGHEEIKNEYLNFVQQYSESLRDQDDSGLTFEFEHISVSTSIE